MDWTLAKFPFFDPFWHEFEFVIGCLRLNSQSNSWVARWALTKLFSWNMRFRVCLFPACSRGCTYSQWSYLFFWGFLGLSARSICLLIFITSAWRQHSSSAGWRGPWFRSSGQHGKVKLVFLLWHFENDRLSQSVTVGLTVASTLPFPSNLKFKTIFKLQQNTHSIYYLSIFVYSSVALSIFTLLQSHRPTSIHRTVHVVKPEHPTH